MNGRAWKAKHKTGNEHHKRCHAVGSDEITLCGKCLDETWIYDPSSKEEITCKKCLSKIDI